MIIFILKIKSLVRGMKKNATCWPPNLEHGNQKTDAKLIVIGWELTL